MTINIKHIYQHDTELLYLLNQILINLKSITMTQSEEVQKLVDLKVQVDKITVEVQALKDALANAGEISPEVQEALDSLTASVQGVDDLNPDA